jgi:hypothetical protein
MVIAFVLATMQTHSPSSKPRRRPTNSITGVAALDDDRTASMADEGGVSAALLDIEDEEERRERHPGIPSTVTSPMPWWVGALAGAALIGGVFWFWSRRSR